MEIRSDRWVILSSLIASILFIAFLWGSYIYWDNKRVEIEEEAADLADLGVLNEKVRNTLISNELKIPEKKLIIELVNDYYKVTASTGVYKFSFDYDKEGKITGIDVFEKIANK